MVLFPFFLPRKARACHNKLGERLLRNKEEDEQQLEFLYFDGTPSYDVTLVSILYKSSW